MPTLPKLIRVEREGCKASLTLDGAEFPFYIAREAINVDVDPSGKGLATVRLTLFAERVEVINAPRDRGHPVTGDGPAGDSWES